jgi:hypothetical protein
VAGLEVRTGQQSAVFGALGRSSRLGPRHDDVAAELCLLLPTSITSG